MIEPTQPNLLYHGGALDIAIKQYGGVYEDWLDLSTGINPFAYPIHKVQMKSWTQLPQTSALHDLHGSASRAYDCPQDAILTGNGTQIFIEQLPKILPKSTIAIMSPTYEEHARNWQLNGHEVLLIDDVHQAYGADHLMIVNPNNPTGAVYDVDELQKLHAHFAKKNGYLIIDEAFMDTEPQHSMCQYAGQKGLIILRSFGKFFGLAGVRIGFLLADEPVLTTMRNNIGLWAVSGVAIDVAHQALNNLVWQNNMRNILAQKMHDMLYVLTQAGFGFSGGTNLFCLMSMPQGEKNAHKYFEKFAQHHILVRKFDNDPTILRFGLLHPDKRTEFNQKLDIICAEMAL